MHPFYIVKKSQAKSVPSYLLMNINDLGAMAVHRTFPIAPLGFIMNQVFPQLFGYISFQHAGYISFQHASRTE